MCRGDGFVEGFESGELWRETAFAGCVDYQHDFSFERGEGVGLAFFCGVGWLVEGRVEVGMGRELAVKRLEVVEARCGGHGARGGWVVGC